MEVYLSDLKVGKYTLRLLDNVEQDSIKEFLPDEPGAYICNLPEDEWFLKNDIASKKKYIIGKKLKILSEMGEGSYIISPTMVDGRYISKDMLNGRVFHIGKNKLSGRMAQVYLAIKLLTILIKNKNKFNYYLVYNLGIFDLLPCLIAGKLLGKKIFIDYEDDYAYQREKFNAKTKIEKIMAKYVDGAICVNKKMVCLFKNKKTIVFNTFGDYRYLNQYKNKKIVLKNNMKFIFSSTLDRIRGADLIIDFYFEINRHFKDFRIAVVGKGPMESHIYKEIKKIDSEKINYYGFVDDYKLKELIDAADFCLVLQRPDHPFNAGSYPSKIEMYAEKKKKILILECKDEKE